MMVQDIELFIGIVRVGLERIAKKQLDEAHIPAVLLLCERPPTPQHPLRVEPLWPGYIFTGSDHLPDDVTAVNRFIRDDFGEPIKLAAGTLDPFLADANADGVVGMLRYEKRYGRLPEYDLRQGEFYAPPSIRKYKTGDVVKILSGIYVGNLATVVRASKQRVHVKAHCFNREIDVHLRTDQVAPAFADAAYPAEGSLSADFESVAKTSNFPKIATR